MNITPIFVFFSLSRQERVYECLFIHWTNVCFNCFLFIWWKIVCLALSECDINRLHQIEKWIIEHVKQSFWFLIDKETPFWWFLFRFMPTYYGILHWFSRYDWNDNFISPIERYHILESFLNFCTRSNSLESTQFYLLALTSIPMENVVGCTTTNNGILRSLLINWVNRSCWFNQNRCIHFNSEQLQYNIPNKKWI